MSDENRVSEEEILRIVNEIVTPYGLRGEIFPGIYSVGVQGDERTHTPVVNLIGQFPGYEILDLIQREISSRTPVNRVTFQVAVKTQSGEVKIS